jgi:DNA-binding response OmpR family regulator
MSSAAYSDHSAGARGLKALLVVEDLAVREAILFALKVEGIEALACSEDDDFAKAEPWACLVLDQGPQSTRASERLKAIRARGWRGATIILVNMDSAMKRKVLTSQGAVLVQKPLLEDELVAAIRAAHRSAAPSRSEQE